MPYRPIALLFCTAVVGACSDSSGPAAIASGTVTFGYSGAVNGNFSVTGAINSTSNPSTTLPWAVGIRDVPANTIGVAANRPQPNARYDIAVVQASRLDAGTSPIDPNCDVSVDVACTGVAVIFNASDAGTSTGLLICGLTSGTVVVQSVTDARISGSFSGEGTCVDETLNPTAFTVSGGAFDVPLTAAPAGSSIGTR